MKLIYNTKYDIIDKSMSCSQVGARKGKNIRNHIWVLNSIMHDVLSSNKKNPIDLQVLDFQQCFDALWLEECLNDLFEGGLKDNMHSLLYESGKNVNIAIKTPTGMSERKIIDKVVMQGDVFGSLMCSKTVDTFGKECLESKKHLYVYKDSVEIPPLAMVDDIVTISECGHKTTAMNAFIDTKPSFKKLQFGVKKCNKLPQGFQCLGEQVGSFNGKWFSSRQISI